MTPDQPSARSLAVIDVPDRCGNAPRKAVLRDFTVARFGGDTAHVLALLSDQVQWHIIGDETLMGIDAVQRWLTSQPSPQELRIATVITHGNECGVDGSIVFSDRTTMGFCDMLVFTGGAKTAKIKEIRSYVVLDGEGDTPSTT